MNNKTRLVDNVENFLLSPKGYKKSWVRSFLAIFLCIVAFSVIISLSYVFGPLSGKTSTDRDLINTFGQKSNAALLNVATYMSISGLVIIVFPFLCAIATWMIGINQVAKSKYFHLFLWFIVGVVAIIALISIILIVRASIFNYNEFPENQAPEETPPERSYSLIFKALSF